MRNAVTRWIRKMLGRETRYVSFQAPTDETTDLQGSVAAALPEPYLNVYAPRGGGPYTCPCCGHTTLGERGGYDLCVECDWEDDGQDDHDSSDVRGGPNGSRSLDAARISYVANGGVRRHHMPPSEPA